LPVLPPVPVNVEEASLRRLTFSAPRYIITPVIKTFKDDETQKIYRRQRSRKLPADIQQVALRKLRMINNALSINDLRVPPANRLEKLSGDRAGQWSIRINDQWRVCFRWEGSDAYNAEIADYH
jgi:proteic killer suppression protein